MNASPIGTAARAFAVAIVLVAAAVLGLIVGNAIRGSASSDAGAAVPAGRTAEASFSLRALDTLQQLRAAEDADANVGAEAPAYVDYAQRHAHEQTSEASADREFAQRLSAAHARSAAAGALDETTDVMDKVDYGQRHAAPDESATPTRDPLARPTGR